MDHDIAQFEKRLTSVESELACLRSEPQLVHCNSASKGDLLRMENRLLLLQERAASKEDLRATEKTLRDHTAEVALRLTKQISDMETRIPALELKLSAEIGALRLHMAALELRILRWLVATVISTSGIVVAVLKLWT